MQAQRKLVLLQKTMVVVEGCRGLVPDSTSGRRRGRWRKDGVSENVGPSASPVPAETWAPWGKLADLPQLVKKRKNWSRWWRKAGAAASRYRASSRVEQERRSRPNTRRLDRVVGVIA